MELSAFHKVSIYQIRFDIKFLVLLFIIYLI